MSGQFQLGLKVLKRMLVDADAMAFQKAKLSDKLFKGETEKAVFELVFNHLTTYHTLPQIETVAKKFPEMLTVSATEPGKYYIEHLGKRFAYDTINRANLASQESLKADPENPDVALKLITEAANEITSQRYRQRIMNVGKEAPEIVTSAYFNLKTSKVPPSQFGWPYLDDSSGGVLAGDVISYVGRPASGKSWFSLYGALHNWRVLKRNVLFVSMEMNTLAIAQRLSAMYAHTNLTQLKMAGYSQTTFKLFQKGLAEMGQEPSAFYVIDGNLAASVDDIFILAAQLQAHVLFVDGAYLLRNKNPRLGRYERVADNCELIKQYTTDLELPTVCSWQFNRDAAKKVKAGKGKADLEDIGYSDAIGQISSIVIGLMQEEGVETLNSRMIEVLKGRNGETGQFRVKWDFLNMDFGQIMEGTGYAKPLDLFSI